MNVAELVVPGLFAVACLAALYRSRTGAWDADRRIGTVIFLCGAAIGLFLDDVLAASTAIRPLVEPIGAVVMIVGLCRSQRPFR